MTAVKEEEDRAPTPSMPASLEMWTLLTVMGSMRPLNMPHMKVKMRGELM